MWSGTTPLWPSVFSSIDGEHCSASQGSTVGTLQRKEPQIAVDHQVDGGLVQCWEHSMRCEKEAGFGGILEVWWLG